MIQPRHDLQPLLEGRNICKSFGGIAALDQVDLVVFPGEVLGVIGPNGSGKTTLVNCLSRLIDVNHGHIYFKGIEITGKKPYQVAQMGLARTFQQVRVYRKLSVLENMLLSRQWRGEGLYKQFRPSHPKTEARAHEIIDFLLLKDLIQEKAGHLSLGQQRILEIGMALMSDPDLFLLDEAASGINPTFLETIKERIRHLNQDKAKTFIIIEHNMYFIEDMCDRVLVLDNGEVLTEGTPEEVIHNPQVIEAYLGTHLEGDMIKNDQ